MNTKKWVVAIYVMLLYFLMPSMAMAADIGFPISVPDTDISKFVLGQLFPTLVGIGGVDTLSNVIGAFNIAILAVGGILATYTLLIGTVSTAHDGEMLGKKFSSVWVPLRTVFGTAMIVPVVNGYCLMQFIVMWLVMQGVGLANMTWQAYIGNAFNNAASYQVDPRMTYELELAQNTLRALTCVAANREYTSGGLFSSFSSSGTNNVALSGADWGWSAIKPSNSGGNCGTGGCMESIFNFGDKGSSGVADTECGIIEIPAISKDNDILSIEGAKTGIITGALTSAGGTSSVGATSSNSQVKSINQVKIDQYKAMIAKLEPIANNIATWSNQKNEAYINGDKNYAATAASEVKAAADAYRDAVLTATADVLKDEYITDSMAQNQPSSVNSGVFAGVIQSANNDGWMLAGAWYMRLVSYNSKIMNVSNDRPTYKISATTWSGEADDLLNMSLKESASIIGQSNMLTQDSAGGYISNNTSSDSSSDGTNKFADMLGKIMTGIDLSQIKMENRHPVMLIIEMGHNLISASVMLIGLVLAGGAIGGAIGGGLSKLPLVGGVVGGVVKGGVDAVMPAITNYSLAIFIPLIIMGFVLSYFIPFLPFLIWLGAVIGWLILVVEAVFAAPLWAVMHLSPNGDDMLGSGKSGYMLVLGLTLRPVLLVMGLAAAFILVQVIGQLVNSVFLDVFIISQGSSKTLGFFSTLMAYVIYTITMVSLVKKIFDVIHVIPDQLLRWVGGGQSQLGEYAKVMSGEGQSQLGSALATSIGQARILSGIGSGGNKGALSNMNAQKTSGGELGDIGAEKLSAAGVQNMDSQFGKGAGNLINRTTGDEGKRDELKATMATGKVLATSISDKPEAFTQRVNALADARSSRGQDPITAYNNAFVEEWASDLGNRHPDVSQALHDIINHPSMKIEGTNMIDAGKLANIGQDLSSFAKNSEPEDLQDHVKGVRDDLRNGII